MSGFPLLHEAAPRKDIKLVEIAVSANADVFVRGRKGRSVVDAADKDDRVKAYRLCVLVANQDRMLIETSSVEPPALKGYLNKYTNVARGYNTRWFVLNYHTIITKTTKTSISVAPFRWHLIQSSASLASGSSSSGAQKWYVKANHQAEAA